MGQKSKIDRMPKEIRDLIAGLLNSNKTIEDIKAKLFELVEGGDLDEELMPSKSAIGTHKLKLERYSKELMRSREVADALAKNLGDEEGSKIARLNIEVMHSILLDLGMAARQNETDDDGNVIMRIDPMGAMLLSKSLDHLGKAAKADTDIIAKARELAAKEAMKAVKNAGGEGLTQDTMDRIEAELKLL